MVKTKLFLQSIRWTIKLSSQLFAPLISSRYALILPSIPEITPQWNRQKSNAIDQQDWVEGLDEP
jgi:hypothetical protein